MEDQRLPRSRGGGDQEILPSAHSRQALHLVLPEARDTQLRQGLGQSFAQGRIQGRKPGTHWMKIKPLYQLGPESGVPAQFFDDLCGLHPHGRILSLYFTLSSCDKHCLHERRISHPDSASAALARFRDSEGPGRSALRPGDSWRRRDHAAVRLHDRNRESVPDKTAGSPDDRIRNSRSRR